MFAMSSLTVDLRLERERKRGLTIRSRGNDTFTKGWETVLTKSRKEDPLCKASSPARPLKLIFRLVGGCTLVLSLTWAGRTDRKIFFVDFLHLTPTRLYRCSSRTSRTARTLPSWDPQERIFLCLIVSGLHNPIFLPTADSTVAHIRTSDIVWKVIVITQIRHK